MAQTAVFLELTASGVAEDENYTAVTSLSEYTTSKTAADHHPSLSSSLIELLTIKVVDSTLFRPLELSSVVVATWMAENAHVVFDVAVADIPKVQMACVLSGLSVFAERKTNHNNGERRVLTARKLSSSMSSATASAALVPPSNKSIPLVNANSSNNNDNNNNNKATAILLIDEDDLLGEEGDWAPDTTAVARRRTKTATDDCGGRAPCDNCTCGRKDNGGNNTDALAAAAAPSTSNCGKCGMGDAFRCASCPFLGKPAFKPGQEQVVLEMQDDL